MKDKIIIQDDRGNDVTVKTKPFLKHIKEFPQTVVSVHADRGRYFTVDDNFRRMLHEKMNKND